MSDPREANADVADGLRTQIDQLVLEVNEGLRTKGIEGFFRQRMITLIARAEDLRDDVALFVEDFRALKQADNDRLDTLTETHAGTH